MKLGPRGERPPNSVANWRVERGDLLEDLGLPADATDTAIDAALERRATKRE